MDKSKSAEQSAKYQANLHQEAKPSTHQHANDLRHKETKAEQKLWSLIRNRLLMGKKFRRQHAIGDYVVDFYCHECKLAIELDGNFHTSDEAREYDNARTDSLKKMGITVLRFWNEDVIVAPEKILQRIASHLA